MKRLTTWTSMDGKAKLIVTDGTLSDKLIEQIAIQRLAEYEDAEEQGLLVRPPYKLGQEVWVISSGGKVCRGEITKIEENIYTEPTTWLTVEFDSDLVNRYEYSSRIDLMIDKVVFLTQEAAEKALEDA